MNKRIASIALILVMLLSAVPTFTYASSGKVATAAYGTPVIDGEIDSVWDKTNYNIVQNCNKTGEDRFKGWFKVLWDEDYIYVLAKTYTTQFSNGSNPWEQDSVDVYIDEIVKGQIGYDKDDYQTRINFESTITGNNYPDFDKIIGKSVTGDNFFVSEMAIPLVTKKTSNGLELGFEILMTASETLGVEMREYLWNTEKGWLYNNTGCYGKLVLKDSVNVENFTEPEFVPAKSSVKFRGIDSNLYKEPNKYITDVVTTFDGTVYNVPILHVQEYASMAIDDVAKIIGGTVENGDTLKKYVRYSGRDKDDLISIKYTEGSEIADYSDTHLSPENGYMRDDLYTEYGYEKDDGYPTPNPKYLSDKLTAPNHLMLDREPVMYNGRLFIPLSSLMAPLRYSMHYDRFNKTLEITTGKNYPDTEVVIYAKDYGAVGDGKTNDLKPILKALNAAFASGKPSKVVLEPNKVYLLGSRQDSLSLFEIEYINNFTFDGQGSTLRCVGPTNTFAKIANCANVKFVNMEIEYAEQPVSHGIVTDINEDELYVELEVPEGFPLPSFPEWQFNYYSNGYWYTMVCDPVKPRPKFGVSTFMDGVNTILPVEGKDRTYRMYLTSKQYIRESDIGDRFLIMNRTGTYNVGENTHDGLIHGGLMWIYRSGDITLENFNFYGSVYNGLNLGENWGDINLINWGLKVKNGTICNTNSDGIHCWDNRGSLIMDGCTMMMTLDDQINTNNSSRFIYNYNKDTLTFDSPFAAELRVGDELLFVDANDDAKTHRILGSAFVKAFSKNSDGSFHVTIDRHVEGIDTSRMPSGADSRTVVFNNECTNKESAIVNSKFAYSRRYAWITKSKNSLFAYNYVYENGGSAIAAGDERRAQKWEGSFANAFTMSNNLIVAPDLVSTVDYPVQIQWQTGRMNDEPALIDGFLMENNVIDSGRMDTALKANAIDGFYLLNNKFMSTVDLKRAGAPIVIKNSRIEKIDGIEYDFKQPVDAAINISACDYDPEDITNIDIVSKNAENVYLEY